jgi:DUF1365 family protein
VGVTLDHIQGRTFHGRHGSIENKFSYGVDYVLSDLETDKTPLLFSYNRQNLTAVFDVDHGGKRDAGTGKAWVSQTLTDNGFESLLDGKILLLAQPRVFNYVFNPVSFWLVYDTKMKLRLVIAEVNNTFGDRHNYLCHNDDLSEITADQRLKARKVFHVSPFQKISGEYEFRFDISDKSVGIWIDFRNGNKGVLATFTGQRRPLTNISILSAAVRRPFGSVRVLGLIYWQALKLKIKGATYNKRPAPPNEEVSR